VVLTSRGLIARLRGIFNTKNGQERINGVVISFLKYPKTSPQVILGVRRRYGQFFDRAALEYTKWRGDLGVSLTKLHLVAL
jgi:hypothetical protein